ncbi:MAG: asparagine synthase (glutamine-hydrolyzing), partial [Pseudomonadota bacterium]
MGLRGVLYTVCGLAGIFSRDPITPVDVALVERMNEIQAHRGPDDVGIYTSHHCVLGHRRLAIIDLSRDGHQPFSSEDNRYQLIYNGEIYNYIELRGELEGLGWRFRTKTDSEVLLKAYQQYGESCLSKFNGMFAFAIYDSENQTLFLARDRLGIKPLYYLILGPRLYFSSEIKALTIIPSFRASINHQSLFDYVVFNRTDIHDETFLHEIRRLPKGHYAAFDQNGLRMRQWWNPEEYLHKPSGRDPGTISREIEEIMVSAVGLRMRSDVPVGSCLSGGLDSSILIGILYHHYNVGDRYQTFTASFPDHPIDETRYVDVLNKRYPFKNNRTFPTARMARERLKEFVYANDDPTTNPSFYSQYEVMRLAKEHGVTVLLDGQG